MQKCKDANARTRDSEHNSPFFLFDPLPLDLRLLGVYDSLLGGHFPSQPFIIIDASSLAKSGWSTTI